MAEVRHCLERGAHLFAGRTCRRYLLQSKSGGGKRAARDTECLLAGIQNGGARGAENGEDRAAVGAPRESHTRVTPLAGALERFKDGSPPDNTSGRSIERSYGSFPNSPCAYSRLQSLAGRRSCWGHERVFIRAYSSNGARLEPLYKSKTAYYEILEVMPTATHVQIKTAYYKQSFIYHPDRNAGSDVATVRFSEINEAYTVLGSKALRKKYDRGLLSQSDLVATARPSGKDTAGTSARQQTERRRSVMDPHARGGVYDFDAFFKSHYSEQLQREKDIRVRKEEMLRKKEETLGEKKLDRMLEVGVGVMLTLTVVIVMSLKRG